MTFIFSQSRKFKFVHHKNQVDLIIIKLLFGYELSRETITDVTDIDYVDSSDSDSTFMVSAYSRKNEEWVNLLGVYTKKTRERDTLINDGKRYIDDPSFSRKELIIAGDHYILIILVFFITVIAFFRLSLKSSG